MLYVPGFGFLHLASVVVSLLLAYAAWRQPLVGRVAYTALFGAAAWVNFELAANDPSLYVDLAPLAVLEAYRSFILGFLAPHVAAVISAIAAGQALIAIGLFVGGVSARVSLAGATVFLLAITPLGAGAAIPSSLVLALGTALLFWNRTVLEQSLVRQAWRRWSSRRAIRQRDVRT